MEDLLRNTPLALIEAGLTLSDLPRFLIEDEFREKVPENLGHPIVKLYFRRFNSLPPRTRREWIESTLSFQMTELGKCSPSKSHPSA